jgi:hypothetical protein
MPAESELGDPARAPHSKILDAPLRALLSGALEHVFAAMFRQQQTMQSERAKGIRIDVAEPAMEADCAVTRTWTCDAPQVAGFRLESNITASPE